MADAKPLDDEDSDSMDEDAVIVKSHTGHKQKDQMLKQIMI